MSILPAWMSVDCLCAVPLEEIHCNWNYRWLWASCECWDLSLGLHVMWVWGGQRAAYKSWSSLSIMWVGSRAWTHVFRLGGEHLSPVLTDLNSTQYHREMCPSFLFHCPQTLFSPLPSYHEMSIFVSPQLPTFMFHITTGPKQQTKASAPWAKISLSWVDSLRYSVIGTGRTDSWAEKTKHCGQLLPRQEGQMQGYAQEPSSTPWTRRGGWESKITRESDGKEVSCE